MNLSNILPSAVRHRLYVAAILAGVLLASPACFAANVTGTVHNSTTNKPAAGDDVVLLAMAQGMTEVARTKTDIAGHYSMILPDGSMYLLRVDHQKATYFGAVTPGKNQVDLEVFDTAPKLADVKLQADMLRIESDDQGLHVVESYFVQNDSAPARTQLSPAGYEVYLPADARIEASEAMSPGGMPIATAPVPSGEKGHYSFSFPIRPGETRFEVSYHLPYSGSFTFHSKFAGPTANLAVVLPKEMKFAAATASEFETLDHDKGVQTLLARNITPAHSINFTITGHGSLPKQVPPHDPAAGRAASTGADTTTVPDVQTADATTTDTRPGIGLGTPSANPDPLDKYKWWILSAFVLVFASAAAIFLRTKGKLAPVAANGSGATTASEQPSFLSALKEELFVLETQRLRGKLTDAEYLQQKAALELVLRSALERQRHMAMVAQTPAEA